MTNDATTNARSVTVLAVGGTGESYPGDDRRHVTGLLSEVTDALDARFHSRWVGYPASYGPTPDPHGPSFDDSVAEGVRRLDAVFADTPGPVMVIGYSQGAVVIRRWLCALTARSGSSEELARVLAVGFVADPHQPPGAVPGCDGWGVAGPGSDLPAGLPAWWVGAPDDVICNASADSLIRDIADLTAAMDLRRPARWAHQMWNTLRSNGFQNAARTSFGPRQWRRDIGRLVAACREAQRYLPARIVWRGIEVGNPVGGRHTAYATEPYRRRSVTDPETTGCQALAHWLQVRATFAAAAPTATFAEVAPTTLRPIAPAPQAAPGPDQPDRVAS
ncbi:hypothetical protein GCM10009624_08110 [Gordonia sinesedis]